MGVSRLAIGSALLLVSSHVSGQEAACDMGYDEFSNNAPAFGNYVLTDNSASARTLRDFRNAAVNYFFQDPNGRNLLGYLGGSGQIRIPICNEIGQCVQAEAEIRFETTGSAGVSPVGVDIGIDFGVGIDGYDITVEDAGGNRITYPAAERDQRELSIPASGPPGGPLYQDHTCRNNDHTAQDSAHQNEEGQPSSGSGGSGGGGGGGPGDAYSGAYPMGGTFVPGGGGVGSSGWCWLFTARTRDGDFISAYALCF